VLGSSEYEFDSDCASWASIGVTVNSKVIMEDITERIATDEQGCRTIGTVGAS
jgi:hypothetical protein